MKPLADWTLSEVKAQCSKQISCFVPTPCPLKLDNGNCRLKSTPDRFLVSEVDYK